MTIGLAPLSLGFIIALVVLVLCVVFIAVGTVPLIIGALVAGCALSRLF